MISIGIDLSLTKTGYAIVSSGGEDGKGIVISSGVIKSKPCGDLPIHEITRISKILDELNEKVNDGVDQDPDIVAIEGLAFMAKGTSLVQLAGLNYMLRASLMISDWKFIIVAPTTLKKFITGSGKGDKDMMMLNVYKNYGFDSLDNNEADAFALAACGLATIGSPICKLGAPQKEVINLLSKQLCKKEK